MVKVRDYTITIESGPAGKWSFRYTGYLPWPKRLILGLCGFEVRDNTKQPKRRLTSTFPL